jgi:hypothetical protein
MNTTSPITVNTTDSSPSLYPNSTESPVSPLIFASAQEANGDVSPMYSLNPLPLYPFCNCPVHDTSICTGQTDFPLCCQAHWANVSGNQIDPGSTDSLPSLVTVSDSEDQDMQSSILTDLDDPLASAHRTNDWITQVHVNTTRITTAGTITGDQEVGVGIHTEISTDPTPIPTIELSDAPRRYGKCWKCKTQKADHLRINCPLNQSHNTPPTPQTRRQRQNNKKRPHKPIRINQGSKGCKSAIPIPEWRRHASPPHRFDQSTLDTIKRNTGLNLIAMLQGYSIRMGRTNFDLWNMRRNFIEEIITHIRWLTNTYRLEEWGTGINSRANNGWGNAWA